MTADLIRDLEAAAEGSVAVTPAQLKLLQYVEANPGRLRGSRQDFPSSICRQDVFHRAWLSGLLESPRTTETKTWELTVTGKAALLRALDVQP